MARIHTITHPVLGVASWAEIRQKTNEMHAAGQRICRWCFGPITPGRRTRCGRLLCAEMIWQASSWERCRNVAMRAANHKCICGGGAIEVDHIIPVSLGGTDDQPNLRPLCSDCHRVATNRLIREKTAYVARHPPLNGDAVRRCDAEAKQARALLLAGHSKEDGLLLWENDWKAERRLILAEGTA